MLNFLYCILYISVSVFVLTATLLSCTASDQNEQQQQQHQQQHQHQQQQQQHYLDISELRSQMSSDKYADASETIYEEQKQLHFYFLPIT